MVEVGLLSVQVRDASSDPGILSGGLFPEWTLRGPRSVSFLQAVDTEGLFWVEVSVVADPVGAEGAKVLS